MTTELMQFLLPYFEKLVLGLDIFAICLLVWGVCLSIKDFFQLAALVVIRTIISYFLNKEIGPLDVQNK